MAYEPENIDSFETSLEAMGVPRPEELPEMAFYRSQHDFITAVVEFAVSPEESDTQNNLIESRENLRSAFRILVAKTLESDELNIFVRRNIIGGAFKDKDEERVAVMQELFPNGIFTEMPLDRDALLRHIGFMLHFRNRDVSGRLGIVDELTEDFTRIISGDVRQAFASMMPEEEHEEEAVDQEINPYEDITQFMVDVLGHSEEDALIVAREWEL